VSIYRGADGQDVVTGWCRGRLDAWPVEHRRAVLQTPLGPTHVVTAGAGDRAVVVLPGTTFCAAAMTDFLTGLAEVVRVIAVDHPGQPGLSTAERPGGDRTRRYGAWLDDLLPRVTDGPVYLLGHSLGAATALASTPSERVAGLLLVNPAGFVGAKVTAPLLAVTAPWVLRPTRERSARLLRSMLGPGHEPPDALVDWLTLVARHTRTTGAPGPLPAASVRRWRSTPVVVAAGEHDRLFAPARLRGPVRDVLGAELALIGDAGHFVPDERPDAVYTLLDRLSA
jgi:pimeloyl-ACP methyl ester carboxylesterase